MQSQAPSVDTLLEAAVGISSPADRSAFLDQACDGDAELRQRVESLIANHFRAGSFLAQPAIIADSAAALVDDRIGSHIGPYKLLERLGDGGMGVVYLAAQSEPVRRQVALKVIKPGMDSAQVIARFEAERQALAMMDHPNIAKILDGGVTETRPFFVMELVRGIPITAYCDEARFSVPQRLVLFVDVCRAVQHAHTKGVIHRDLKPSNILVTSHDGVPVVKIIDFGVAKALGAALTERTLHTGFAQIIGTPLYMSPEQAEFNELGVDTRSDVYALGVILYELLTGETPFDPETVRSAGFDEFRRMIREVEPPSPSHRLSTLAAEKQSTISQRRGVDGRKLGHVLRGELDWIVMRALEKDRQRRYESASAFATDVQRYLNDEPVQACPPSATYRLRKFVRRNKGKLAAAGVLGAALLVAVSAVGWAARDRSAQQEQAELALSERKARTLGQVQLIQQEVAQHLHDQKWSAGLDAARRASDLVRGADVDADVFRSISETQQALEFVKSLEGIRSDKSDWTASGFAHSRASERYAAAFRGQGIDVERMSPVEAAERLRVQPEMLPAIAPALDDWALCINAAGDNLLGGRVFGVAELVDPDPLRQRFRQALRTGDAPAVVELAKSPDLVRQPAATLASLGIALRILGRPDDAIDLLSGARLLHPSDFWVHFDLAQAFDRKRPPNYEQSAHSYRAALAIRPDSKASWNNLGIALRMQGRPNEAVDCLNKAIELDRDFAIAYSNLAHAYMDQKNLDQAVASFRKCIELNPNISSVHNSLGVALTRQDKWNDAANSFGQAIAVDDQNAEAHGNLGNCFTRQRKYGDAVASYQKSLAIDPNSVKILLNLAGVLQLQGKSDASIEYFRKAIALNPKLAAAHIQLARCLCNPVNPALRDPDEALRSAKQAVELMPQSMSAWLALGWANYRTGDFKASVAALERSLELAANPKGGDPQQWLFLAMAKWQLGDKVDSRRWFDKSAAWMNGNAANNAELQRIRAEAEALLEIKKD